MSDQKARVNNVGGEVLCEVFQIMSRIAKNSIKLPQDTTCSFDNNILLVQGKLGKATLPISELFTIKQKDNEILVLPKDEKDKTNPLWGTTSAHVKNTLSGVCNGYSKTLVLIGTGYRASVVDSKLKLQLGFSHDIDYEIPKEVKIECPKQNIIKITIMKNKRKTANIDTAEA